VLEIKKGERRICMIGNKMLYCKLGCHKMAGDLVFFGCRKSVWLTTII
jgi:hypothetical protein